MYNFKKIRDQRKDGKNFSEIARDLDLNRKTVRKYALSNTPPKYSPRLNNNKEDYFEPFRDTVVQKMNLAPDWTSPEIFEWIKAKGYKGSERTVYRRMQMIKGEKPKERYFEQEYIPGEQAQFDFTRPSSF